jgi:hypothetical protein
MPTSEKISEIIHTTIQIRQDIFESYQGIIAFLKKGF